MTPKAGLAVAAFLACAPGIAAATPALGPAGPIPVFQTAQVVERAHLWVLCRGSECPTKSLKTMAMVAAELPAPQRPPPQPIQHNLVEDLSSAPASQTAIRQLPEHKVSRAKVAKRRYARQPSNCAPVSKGKG